MFIITLDKWTIHYLLPGPEHLFFLAVSYCKYYNKVQIYIYWANINKWIIIDQWLGTVFFIGWPNPLSLLRKKLILYYYTVFVFIYYMNIELIGRIYYMHIPKLYCVSDILVTIKAEYCCNKLGQTSTRTVKEAHIEVP